MANMSEYNELRFDREKLQSMSLSERFAAITGVRYFDIESAIEQADDKQAVVDRLVWLIWGGKQVVDDEMFEDLRDEIKTLAGESSSGDEGSSEGSSEDSSDDSSDSSDDSSDSSDDSSDSSDDSSDSGDDGSEPQSGELSSADVDAGDAGGLSQNDFDDIDQNGDGVIDINPVQGNDGGQVQSNDGTNVYTGEDNG